MDNVWTNYSNVIIIREPAGFILYERTEKQRPLLNEIESRRPLFYLNEHVLTIASKAAKKFDGRPYFVLI